MNDQTNPVYTQKELETSLQALGAHELEQRLEFAPLLAGSVDGGADGADVSVCCSCKIPPDEIFGDEPVIAIDDDPYVGDRYWGTGPTSGGGF